MICLELDQRVSYPKKGSHRGRLARILSSTTDVKHASPSAWNQLSKVAPSVRSCESFLSAIAVLCRNPMVAH